MPKVIQVRNFHSVLDEEWRVLSAVETGMRNHEFVPLDLLHDYASIHQSGKNFIKILRNKLVPLRLIAYETGGYRLTNLGYDFLALHKFIKSSIVYDLSNFQLFATGKESDLYFCKPGQNCRDEHGIDDYSPIVLKFHRLGRTSFKQVRNKREYKAGNSCSWLYMNRISATREYSTMKELYDAKLPVPVPLGHNRGAVAMEYINSVPLFKFSKYVLENGAAAVLYLQARFLLVQLAQLGLVHGDFNEFNLLVEIAGFDSLRNERGADEPSESRDSASEEEDSQSEEEDDTADQSEEENETTDQSEDEEEPNENLDCPYIDQDVRTFKLRLIDFPQVISRDNKQAQEIYARDRHGITSFFGRFTAIDADDLPPAEVSDIAREGSLDVRLRAPGFRRGGVDVAKGEIGQEEEGEEDGEVDERGAKSITVQEVKKRVAKERSKNMARQRISRQQRNIKKKENRKDMQADLF